MNKGKSDLFKRGFIILTGTLFIALGIYMLLGWNGFGWFQVFVIVFPISVGGSLVYAGVTVSNQKLEDLFDLALRGWP